MKSKTKTILKKIEVKFKNIFFKIMPSYLAVTMLRKNFAKKIDKLLELVEKVTYCNDFSDYAQENGIKSLKQKIKDLKKGLGEESLRVINMVLASSLPYDFYDFKGIVDKSKLPYFKPVNYDLKVKHCIEKYKKIYSFDYYIPEVFYYKQGLTLVNKKVLKYIKGKDFLDCGGFVGDSIAILQEFEPKKIHTFEPDKFILNMLKNNLKINKINKDIYKLINAGVYNENCKIKSYCGKSSVWDMTTIDKYVKDNNINPSLIKMDIEGGEYKALIGAKETIKKFKSVIISSIYHNAKQFFELKPLIESWKLNYKFLIRILSYSVGHLEINMIAYPKNLEEK